VDSIGEVAWRASFDPLTMTIISAVTAKTPARDERGARRRDVEFGDEQAGGGNHKILALIITLAPHKMN